MQDRSKICEKICAIVPSLNPDEKLVDVVTQLNGAGFFKIILVNDGSESDEIFFSLSDRFGCDILTHFKNYGKGRGMKNALNFYMNNYSNQCSGVVFADGDNQHHIDDIVSCSAKLLEYQNSLILGVRDFDSEGVPPRSKFGNNTTSNFFRLFCGLNISDTQTGLRALGNEIIPEFLDLSGERFEYETNMLLHTKDGGIPIIEVPIRTIYIEENKTSHFNPIRDSVAIYRVILKYLSSSLASSVVDLVGYQLIFWLSTALGAKLQILVATALARVISSIFNYNLNCKYVFRSNENGRGNIVKYYLLVILQMGASYGGVYGMSLLFGQKHTLWIKIIVDTILFLISFKIQQNWVFKNGNSKK